MPKSSPSPAELSLIAHEQLRDASKFYLAGRYLQAAALAVGVVIMFVPKFAYFGALAVLVIQATTWYTRQTAQQKQGVGDEIRRRGLLMDALGPYDQSYDLAELLAKISTSARDRALSKATSDYFASDAQYGLARLRDHLRENSFWNRRLFSEASKRGGWILVTITIVSVLVVFLAIALVPQDTAVNIVRIFVFSLTFLLGYTLLVDVLAWRSASTSIERLDRQLDAIKHLDDSSLATQQGQIMTILSEYAVATSKIAPIPPTIYENNRDSLNKLWKDREDIAKAP